MAAPRDALSERRTQTVRLQNVSIACVDGTTVFLHDAFDIVLHEPMPVDLQELVRRAEGRLNGKDSR